MIARVSNFNRRPWSNDLFDGFQQLFDGPSPLSKSKPRCDIEENDEQFILTFDVPGYAKDEIQIEFENSILKVEGSRKDGDEVASTMSHIHRERWTGPFSRSFQLPESVNAEGITAIHENGVLQVTLAKKEKAKPKKIDIKVLGATKK